MPESHRFHGGVHPHERKSATSDCPLREAPLFTTYVVPLQQHIGAPPKLLVAKKDTVSKGQLLAEPGGFVSAGVHAPTSGTVTAITEALTVTGARCPAVEITADGNDTAETGLAPLPNWAEVDPATLRQRLADAGIVGMGGAAFPSHVKLSPPPAKPIDTLIVNGVECEPCLTADHRLMLEEPDRILTGTRIAARILAADKVCVGIEANKPDAIERLRARAADSGIRVVRLPVRYPQGAEKQLIYAITGRRVPTGGLPLDVGCVVHNVGTVAAIAAAVLDGTPLIERGTTITGTPVREPGNWRLRIGTPLVKVLELVGGLRGPVAKVIFGGPMMGRSVSSLDTAVTKGTSGILLLAPAEVVQYSSGPCIRCGRCTDACPMQLAPGILSVQIECENFDLAESWRAADCIECGSCAYVCPSHRPLVQHLARAKAEIMAKRRAAGRN